MKEEIFQEKLDSILETGETSVTTIIGKLGVNRQEFFHKINSLGGYSTAGILTPNGTITKNKIDE